MGAGAALMVATVVVDWIHYVMDKDEVEFHTLKLMLQREAFNLMRLLATLANDYVDDPVFQYCAQYWHLPRESLSSLGVCGGEEEGGMSV